jgi:hypothetical protein
LIGYYKLFGWGNHHASYPTSKESSYPTSKEFKHGSALIRLNMHSMHKLLKKTTKHELSYCKTKGAYYAPIIEDDNEAGDMAVHGIQYYLNN